MAKPSIKVGDRFESNRCGLFEVVSRDSYKKITIKFIDTGFTKVVTGDLIRSGKVRDPYFPSMYGVGYYGEAEVDKKSFSVWSNMLKRCYCDKDHIENPTYSDCEVSEEWQEYGAFKIWFDENYVEGWSLDKDVLGDGKHYSEENCCFLPQKLNTAITVKSNGEYSHGVYIDKKREKEYSVKITIHGKGIYLGRYDTIEKAKCVYLKRKKEYLNELIDLFGDSLKERVIVKLRNWEYE